MNIQFTPKSKETCVKALLPVVGQHLQELDPTGTNGSAPITGAINAASGNTPFSEVIVSNSGCRPLRLTVSYLTGSDCDNCTPDTVTAQTINIDVPAGVDSFPLPQGLISNIDYTALDVFGGATTAVAATQTVFIYAVGSTPCSDCQILVP